MLSRISNNASQAGRLSILRLASDRLWRAENDMFSGIGKRELVFNIPYARIINAAFVYTREGGGRFNGPERGAWYAGLDIDTAKSEIDYHIRNDLEEIEWVQEIINYNEYLADFGEGFHDIRENAAFQQCLDPNHYTQSQALAANLLGRRASGIVYPSVRHNNGDCIACFRPALVGNVRKNRCYRFSWSRGSPRTEIKLEEERS